MQVQVLEGTGMMVMMEMTRETKKITSASQKSQCCKQNIKLQRNEEPQRNRKERSWQRGAGQKFRKSERGQKKGEDHPLQIEGPQRI